MSKFIIHSLHESTNCKVCFTTEMLIYPSLCGQQAVCYEVHHYSSIVKNICIYLAAMVNWCYIYIYTIMSKILFHSVLPHLA